MSATHWVFLRAIADQYGAQRAIERWKLESGLAGGWALPFLVLEVEASLIQHELTQEHGVAVQDLVWDFWEYEYYTEAM